MKSKIPRAPSGGAGWRMSEGNKEVVKNLKRMSGSEAIVNEEYWVNTCLVCSPVWVMDRIAPG